MANDYFSSEIRRYWDAKKYLEFAVSYKYISLSSFCNQRPTIGPVSFSKYSSKRSCGRDPRIGPFLSKGRETILTQHVIWARKLRP